METMRLRSVCALRQLIRSNKYFQPQQATQQISSFSPVSLRRCPGRPRRSTPELFTLFEAHPNSSSSISHLCRSTRRFTSTRIVNGTTSASEESLSLSQRMRKLSREYGYSAVGVYFALSALDFPFCYLAVSFLGAERIAHWEHAIMSYVKGVVKWLMPNTGEEKEVDEGQRPVERKVLSEEVQGMEHNVAKRVLEEQTPVLEDHGYAEAEKADQGDNASVWTKLALAYAIHKSFIFIRVPLTAAVTPKVVKTLRSWGWNIGKMPTKKAASRPGVNIAKTGLNSEK